MDLRGAQQVHRRLRPPAVPVGYSSQEEAPVSQDCWQPPIKNVLGTTRHSILIHFFGDSALTELDTPTRLFTQEAELNSVRVLLAFHRLFVSRERGRK